MVMLLHDRRHGAFDLRNPSLAQSLAQMDLWLTAIKADMSNDPAVAKIRRTKPADLVEGCWTKDETPRKINETLQYRAGRCNEIYPAFSSPRGVAGAPISNDVIKCQTRAVSVSDYKVTFTADDMTRLRRIFPEGVCDWSKPGAGQQKLTGTWIVFKGADTGTN
jgi:hypothetical protein